MKLQRFDKWTTRDFKLISKHERFFHSSKKSFMPISGAAAEAAVVIKPIAKAAAGCMIASAATGAGRASQMDSLKESIKAVEDTDLLVEVAEKAKVVSTSPTKIFESISKTDFLYYYFGYLFFCLLVYLLYTYILKENKYFNIFTKKVVYLNNLHKKFVSENIALSLAYFFLLGGIISLSLGLQYIMKNHIELFQIIVENNRELYTDLVMPFLENFPTTINIIFYSSSIIYYGRLFYFYFKNFQEIKKNLFSTI